MPRYLGSVTDPAFDSRVTRVSDQTAMGVDLTGRQYIRNAYAKKSAWNRDSSLILLSQIHPAPLLDGRTYRFIRLVDDPADATWSNTRPTVIFGVQPAAGNFVSLDVATGRTTIELHLDGYQTLSLGDGEGNLSDDDRLVALHGTRPDGTHDLIVFDQSTRQTVVRSLGRNVPNWIGMSHSGQFVVINWNLTGSGMYKGTGVWDSETGAYLRQIDVYNSHGDVVYDTTGREVYVAGNDCERDAPPAARCAVAATLSAFPLDGSRAYPVLAKATGYVSWGEHASGHALDRHGWVYMSDYGAPPPKRTNYPGRDTAFAVEVDPALDGMNPVVQPFAHMQHQCGLPYRSMPFAVPDPAGDKVLFGSEWEQGPLAPVYAYVAEQAPAATEGSPGEP